MKTALQKKIFIVDDDPLWSIKMSEILSNLGYTNILRFESGEDCVNNLHQHPAVIFLDFTMKAMDGLQVLKNAKDYLPGIDIIFCTANKDLGLAVKAMKSGSFDFLVKQHTSEETIKNVLESLCTEDAEKIY
jgi:DNA-binding NtrC family response regulator